MTSSTTDSNPTQTYYDDPSNDQFYALLWGGEDLHIGIYTSPSDTIPSASQRTVAKLAERLHKSGLQLGPQTRILDLVAGYGGAARYLARTYGCEVVCLNLSQVQNARNEELTRGEGLNHVIRVVEGVFEDVPAAVGEGYDVVWSQDSFLHSLDRAKIVDEIDRVLKKDGDARVVFTDIMASNDALHREPALMKVMLERLLLSDLATVDFYKNAFEGKGFKDLGYQDRTADFGTHYRKLGEELKHRRDELVQKEGVKEDLLEKHKRGTREWAETAEKGFISDNGAYRLNSFFVIGGIVTAIAYASTSFAAHHVRYHHRTYALEFEDPQWKRALSALALIAGVAAGIACACLTISDTRWAPDVHGPMLSITFLGIAISASCTEIVYSEQMHISTNYQILRR
ncbi:MAG: hypothetical protein Q9178_004554 [Gyalolechia marmorata]